jgi:hypothetical protein
VLLDVVLDDVLLVDPLPADPPPVDPPPDDPLSDDADVVSELVPLDLLDDFEARLSVLKKPEPLNVTPTGVKTLRTGRTLPVSGWAISVRVSSWKPCWTSMVSPVSTNL